MDSCSSESYINSDIPKKLGLTVYPSSNKVTMALSNMKAVCLGFCITDLIVNGEIYKSFRFNVFKKLCSDIILGLDFQTLHKKLVFEFSGKLPELKVNQESNCALVAAKINNETLLFSNIKADCKPISTESRRFNRDDSIIIKSVNDRWSSEGIIQRSQSPWYAQVLIV